MIATPEPGVDAIELVAACARRVRHYLSPSELNVALRKYPSIMYSYRKLGSVGALHSYTHVDASPLTGDHFKRMYENHLVAGSERASYDEILMGAPDGVCTYCGLRPASVLDHHIPASVHRELSVLPLNLVPACRDCNTVKDAFCPTSESSCLFHPYFDDWDSHIRLTASLIHSDPIQVTYSVRAVDPMYQPAATRAEHHIELLKLTELYVVYAHSDLAERKQQFADIYAAGGSAALQSFLKGEAASRAAVRLNSWSSALLRCLASDIEFCQGGFARIA
jgi:5-methylcytosine-specific restriction endonuclease McrA